MNKIHFPYQITFVENSVSQEEKDRNISRAYGRLFEIARKNIIAKRVLTSNKTKEYTKVQYAGTISNNRGSSKNIKSQQPNSIPTS